MNDSNKAYADNTNADNKATRHADSYAHIVATRKSARAFKSEAVAQSLLDKVFDVSLRAPSNCNT